jgi:hypothetical protein
MSEIAIQIIIARLKADAAFRQQLRDDPAQALEGYDFSREEFKTLAYLFGLDGWMWQGQGRPDAKSMAEIIADARERLADYPDKLRALEAYLDAEQSADSAA